MGAVIANIAKGKWARYAEVAKAGTGGAKLRWMLFSGTETDANIKDAATITALIATAVDEATFTGYTAGGLDVATADITVATDTGNDWTTLDVTVDPQWSPTTAQALTRICLYYDPDGTKTYGNCIPLFVDDFALTTPTSGTITYQVATGGCCKAA
jgi:hypothetical protein